jgi:hypothetical protein
MRMLVNPAGGGIASLLAALALMPLAGCNDDEDGDPQAKAAEERRAALEQRVVGEGELRGFKALGEPVAAANAAAWAQAGLPGDQAQAEAARLRSAGFVAGVAQPLVAANLRGAEGVSTVVQYRSAERARAEVTYVVRTAEEAGGSFKEFKVPGIADAHGYTTGTDGAKSHDVVFAAGPYVYVLGVAFPEKLDNPPRPSQIAAAARKQFERVQ